MRLLYLRGDPAVLEAHIEHRTGHFMPGSLLQSQLDTLEEPAPDEKPIVVDVAGSVEETVGHVMEALAASPIG